MLGGAAAWENVDSCDEKVDIFWHGDEKKLYLFIHTISVSKVREHPRIFHANPDKVG